MFPSWWRQFVKWASAKSKRGHRRRDTKARFPRRTLLFFELLEARTAPAGVQLIHNSGFDVPISAVNDWTATGNFFYAGSQFANSHSTPGYEALAKPDGSKGNNLVGEIYQQFTIPDNATSVVLTYWVNVSSDDAGASKHDVLNARILNSSGSTLAAVGSYSNLNRTTAGTYQQATFDLSAFHGLTVRLDFLATTDASNPTVFRIDDVSVIATTTPHISAINPAQPIVDSSRQWVSIVGTGFGSSSTVTVYAGSIPYPIPVDRLQYRSSGQIDVYVGLTEARTDWSVEVKNSDGAISPRLTFPVVPKAVQLTDFAVSAVSGNPISLLAGDQATVSFLVTNQSNVAAPATSAKLRLDSGTTVADADPLLADVTVPALGAGQSQPLTKVVTIPTGTAAGSYYVGVMVNPTGSVQEIDRSNNQGVMAITVTASPQPQIFGSPTTTLAQSTSPQSVSLTGINFNPGATVRLHDPSGNLINGLVTGQNNTTSITVSQVFGSIGNWLVEVINPGAIISSAFHLGVADAATIPAVGNDLALRLPFEGAHPVTQEFKGPNVHSGIDFGMPEGTKIVAVADGEVVKVDPQNIDPNPGIFVKIKHHGRTSDWYSLYYHLKQRMVDVGDKIKQGDVIGYSGNTGTSTGPHLHFEMRAAAGDQNAAKPPVPMTGQVLASDGSVKSTTITSFDLGTTYRPTLPSVSNGSFLSGIMASWSTIGHGVADAIQHTLGDWWARLTTHSPVDLSQAITTPSQSFDLTFDYQFQTTTGALDVSLNSVPLGTIPAPSSLPTGPSKFRITVTDPSLLAQTNAVLDFHFDGAANSEIDLTNIATETNPPSAVSGAADISTGGATTQDFTVTYADNVAVDVSTLHTGNILVTGPNGYSQVATFVGVDNNTNGSPRSATYRITAPNGKWGSADNGTYTLSMQFNQVSDTRGYFVPYGIFGSFAVAIPPAPINDLAWQYKASLPQALTAPLGAVLNGKVYVAGGPDYYGYDPSTNTWTTLASVPAGGFHDGGAVAIGSKLYGIGFGASPVTEIYDPVSNSWSAGAAMPTPRFYGAVAEVGGKVYAIGGQDSVGNISGKVEAYDPATNTWVSRAAMLTPRASTTAVSLNGLIYVFAGTGANLSDLTAVEVYDPATNTWASKSHMPTIRAGAGAVVLGGKIYVVGGFDGGTHNLASVDEYDPGTDSWRTLPSGLLTPRVSAVTVVVNGNAYVIGGSSDTGPLSTVEAGVSRQHFAIVGTTSGTAGSAFTFTVTALTSSNATDTTYNGTVHFSSSDSQAVLPADATLVGGVGTFSVTFGTAGLQMLTATDTLIGSITGTTGITGGDPINVTPAAATHLSVNVFSNPVAGSNFSFNVTAVDQFNNTDTNYIGTVHFSSTDAQAALPADATLTNGFGNFNGILNTPGSQTLTAADTATSSINGSSAVTVVVGIPTSMALGVSTVFAAYEQAVTLTATVAVVPPNTGTPNAGTVTFMDGTTPIGSAPVNAGTATFVTTSITVGTHALTAYYSGFGSNYADSRSGVAPNSIITTFAGNGSATYGGDNGPATAAVMTHPQGVAVDGSGNVFIADSYNNRIRRVDASTGIITTITGNGTAGFSGDGGLATAAALNFATGNSPTPNIAVDANGHLFIADTNNNRVREVDLSTGIITTVAGNGTGGFSGEGVAATAASLSLPVSVAVDANGNLYVTDNQRIRKVTASTGVITTVAGNGLPTYSGDGGLATAASLRNPAGLAVDSNGNIYIADCSNYRIRKVTASTGVITTVAGNGSLGSGGDGGLATLAQLYIPTGVAVDSSGNILIADQSNNRIRKVTVSTGMITTIAGSGTAGFGGDGGTATFAVLNRPEAVALDATGNLFISDYYNNRIRKVDLATGTIGTIAGGLGDNGLATATTMSYPVGVATDANGNLFLVDRDANRVRKVSVATGVISAVAGNGTSGFAGDGGSATAAALNNPYGVAVDSSGNVFIADAANARVRKVDHSTGEITTIAGNGTAGFGGDNGPATGASLNYPVAIALDATGHLYISDYSNHRIRRVDLSTGIIATVAGNGTGSFSGDGGQATAASLSTPTGITVDLRGNLYFADYLNFRIRQVNLSTGVISTVAGNGIQGNSGDAGPATLASLSYSWDVAVDGSGHLLIADYGNRRIREVDLSTGIITTAAGSGTSGFSGDDGAASAAQISDAFGVAVDSQANLFVADSSNKRIREVKAGWQLKVAMVSLTVTAPSSVTAGTGMNFTVTALDQHNATATGYAGTVHFTSSDGQAVLSADATLTNGIGQFAAFLQTAGNQTVTAADTNIAITGTSSPIGVSAAAAFRFAINGPQVAAAGTAFTFTISAQDRYFNTATGYNGTVHFASSDFAATLPADTTLTSGTGTFSATLKTAGVRVVAVTDTATSTITGISGNITISNAVTHFAVSAPTNTTAGNGLLVVVTALDQFNNTAVGYSGTIQLTSTDPKAYLQSGTTLTNGVGYFAVILKTAGNQTITATDSANTTITGISITMSVTPAAVDHFLVTAPNTTITGNTFSLTFTAQDSFNNTVPNYAGTAQFSSTDTTAALPPNSTLTSGVGTFSATLNAPGAQKIVATDAANYITGSSNAIASRGLIVNSLTPTATGFVATFNKAFDPSVLNLYDAFNTYGASDVNLVSGNVVETITFGGTITGGSFTLTFKGATTGPITYSSIVASLVANIQSALNALPTVGVGNSVVSATSLASANVAFQGALGLAIQPAFVATSSLTGSSPAVSATVATQATPIKGTLLIDPSNTSMTFVKSGTGTAGVLSAGSYSLTFRSASDGFKDTSGSTLGFLDGNNDGVPGDNYLTTLTVVSTPGVILNIPDFARGPDSSRNVRIPNNNGTAVQALSFTGTSGGTFTLALTGFNNGSYSATTGPISYSAVASTLASNIQSALSALSSPISGVATNIGNTITTPVGANVTVTFQSDLGGAVQPNMVVNTAGLSGASPAANVTTTVAGINLGIPISLSNVAGLTDVTFTLTYNPAYLTIPLTGNTFNASPTSTFTVVGTPSGGVANFSYHSSVPVSGATVTLGQIVAQVPNSTASSYKGKELLHLSNTVINGLNPGVVNSIAFVAVTSGTFSLSFKGATTGTLTYTTDQATLQSNIKTALEALPTIGVGNMLVSASATVYTVYFQGTLALTDQPAILLASSNVSGQIAGAAVGVGKGANSDGVHVIAYLGDASGDGSVSSGDGSLISRVSGTLDNNIVAGVFGGLAAYRLADPVIVGDVSGNAAVDSGDVTLINQSTSGSQQTRLPPIPTGLTISPTGPDPTLSLPTNLTAAPGTSVVVPLYLDTARPEGSLGLMEAILALRYDPKVFTVSAQDVHLGTLPLSGSGWKLQTVVNAQTGEIGIDLFSPTPIVSAGGGSLVTLTLHVLADAPAGASGINLVRSVNPTGQRQYVTTASDAAGPYILHPAVTDDGLDAGVDGRVTVPSLVMETVNVPQATIVTAAALSTAAEIAHMPAEVLSTSRARALNLVDQVFGNLEDPGLVSSFSEFGQPDALLDTDSTDQPLPTSAWAKPTQGLYGLERDWMPTNCMGFVGRGARHGVNATKLLSDTEAEIADADFFAMVKFFAHEVTDRS